MLRNPNKDPMKSKARIDEILVHDKKCTIPGCNDQITFYAGPASEVCCRTHQLQEIAYGGLYRAGESHTMQREWICSHCGYDPREDSRFDKITDPAKKLVAMRAVMHGDHIIARADGGDDSKKNVQALCVTCHTIKSVDCDDYGKVTQVID